jgi:hypothetical protein
LFSRIITLLGVALSATFSSFFYRAAYLVVFAGGLIFGLIPFLGAFAILASIVLIVPGLTMAAIATILALVHVVLSFRRKDWTVGIGHLVVPVAAVALCLVGFVSAGPLMVACVAPQLKFALTNFRAGIQSADDNIEIISANPEIAVYRVGYFGGFASPGVTNFIVLDETGRFAELAPTAHARDLAGTPELKLRKYDAYCNLSVAHWVGPYYFASLDDVDGCIPR